MFLERVEQVNRLVETGFSIGGRFESVLPLTASEADHSVQRAPFTTIY